MKSQCASHAPHKIRGFTLLELLVAVSVIIALAGVVVGASRSAQRAAAKVSDMNNLRNLATASTALGSDNVGRLPTLHPHAQSAPYWLLSREILQTNGIYKENCYAPGRNIYGGAPNYDWWFNYGDGTPTHYVYFANDAAVPTNAWFLRGKVTPPSKSEYRGAIPYDQIMRDPTKAFARSITDDAWYPVLWAGLVRDFSGTPRVGAIMHDGEALGVNVMYLDGHAEWVPKNLMKPRYTAGKLTVLW